MTEEDRKCLEQRQYWCFLLSSIITFCICMLIVVSWRVFAYFCCQNNSQQQFEKLPNDNDQLRNGKIPGSDQTDGQPTADQLQLNDNIAHIGWVTEAKDWAGELISGQTATGRILVSLFGLLYHNQKFVSKIRLVIRI